MRPLTFAAALVIGISALAAAVSAAPGAAHVLLVTDVGENAQRTMPASLWRKLAVEYVGTPDVTAEEGTTLPDQARCRGANALYAVLATFDRAMRLPGLAQDSSRAYGIARFTVRNCVSGTVSETKMVRIESEPIPEAERVGEFNAERTWERAVRTTLARDPLALGAVARIVRIDHGVVYLENGGGFAINQVLLVLATGAPPRQHIELVVLENTGKYAQAGVLGKGTPHVGDYVEAAPK